jgi:hypothetical protein
MMCGKNPTIDWPNTKNCILKIKTTIVGRKLLLDVELACGNLQEEKSVKH